MPFFKEYRHWRINLDATHIAWLILNRADSSVNSLNKEVFSELDDILTHVPDAKLKALIICSGKEKGFIAGADISQFTKLTSETEAFELIRSAQLILDKLENLNCVTIALIHGFCLGGGLELALACQYRIASKEAETILGLPEVKLGIHPGWGGTVRLPRLIGGFKAMRFMLAGEPISAKQAKSIGLVDEAIPQYTLKEAAIYYAHKPPAKKQKVRVKFSNAKCSRVLVARGLRFYLSKRVNINHYPAPYRILKLWEKNGVGDVAFVEEAKSIANLMMTAQSRNLVRVFFLREKLKSQGKGKVPKKHHLHVIGAGTMGADITAWFSTRNFKITIQDQTAEALGKALKRISSFYDKKTRYLSPRHNLLDTVIPGLNENGISKADVVIEAVFEDLKLKKRVLKEALTLLKPEGILATNTSSIPLEDLTPGLSRPEILVGLHFFNPATKMPLVEVVKGRQTNETIANAALQFVQQAGKLPLLVKSSPGFLINRILMPYLLEALLMLTEGLVAETIDQAATSFGMPIGPLALVDQIGLDICLSVANNLIPYYGGEIPNSLINYVEKGNLGIKAGRGIYVYNQGKKINGSRQSPFDPIMTERLILRLINEAVACLHDKIVEDADLLDAGLIFGIGFPPFRGGAIHYAKTRGVNEMKQMLEKLSKLYGPRFSPSVGWMDLLS